MKDEKTIRTYNYQGRELGRLVQSETGEFRGREFRTDLSVYEAIDLVREMSPEAKVHMRHDAYAVHRLLEAHGLNPDDYVDDEDVMVHVANRGYKNLTELNHGDHRAWELVKQRGLEKDLFKDFQPAQK